MSKKPQRNWGLVFGLGIPLLVCGAGAMAITFATLIDVARLSGLPFPVFFPFVVDGGMIGCMVAANEFKRRGINGAGLAWVGFIGLSVVSVVANSSHARMSADLDVIPIWAAGVIGAIPSAVLLLMTRLIENMIPDERERAKLHTRRGTETRKVQTSAVTENVQHTNAREVPSEAASAGSERRLRIVDQETPSAQAVAVEKSEVVDMVLQHIKSTGSKPTGAVVGDWLGGKSAKTGQRFLAKLETDGALEQDNDTSVPGLTASRR
ncbi:MAG: DUF2637 domain-containing protein [Leucobacter sp.]